MTNLVCKTQFISESLDHCGQVDVVYTDFTKAFDRLDHDILLHKLDMYGFSNSLLHLFQSYLQNRYQFVQYRGYCSDKFLQVSGVPQGSTLGPLLFVMFLNDIVSELRVNYLIYADDLKLLCKIDNVSDCQKLQSALEAIDNWCSCNNLPLNASKCNVMTFTRKTSPLTFAYKLGDSILCRPSYVKDLGVIFDPKLSFTKHIETVASSAFKCLGFIIRNSNGFVNVSTLRLLYISFIRSKLEYASVVWSPIYGTHIAALEKVQRRFLKSASYILDHIYPPVGFSHSLLLSRFDVHELAIRRSAHQVIFLYKVLNNLLNCPDLLSNVNLRIPRLSARSSNVLCLPTPRTNVLMSSPLYQMISQYNNIETSYLLYM